MYPKSVADKIVERRLHRDRRAREKEFSQVAGMRLSNEDVKAARLWGFLAKNPDLNARVHQIFQEYEALGVLGTTPIMMMPCLNVNVNSNSVKRLLTLGHGTRYSGITKRRLWNGLKSMATTSRMNVPYAWL